MVLDRPSEPEQAARLFIRPVDHWSGCPVGRGTGRGPGRERPGWVYRGGRRDPRSEPNGPLFDGREDCRATSRSRRPRRRPPRSSRRWAKRSGGLTLSPVKRSPSTQVPAAARSCTRATSVGDRPTSRLRPLVTGKGSDGWLRTGATTTSSTIMARANPPVKHMPTAPTPGPPQRSCSSRARARNQAMIGLVLPWPEG